jgi:MarR family transcriptional regulator, organic hydroperoxide resistance regulator
MPSNKQPTDFASPGTAPVRRSHRGVGAMLRYAHRAYSRVLQKRLAPFGLTVAQYLHLRTLWQEGPMTQIEISQHIGIEKASSTAVLDALEKSGMIDRARDERDRRKINVRLTPAGKSLQDAVLTSTRAVAAEAVLDLDEAEVALFFGVLTKMIRNLERSPTMDAGLGEAGPDGEVDRAGSTI